MFTLYIGNSEAAIQTGTAFKLTRENAALTSAGDYTLEVTLPLRSCPRNTALFGFINRMDRPHNTAAAMRLPFTMNADNITLSGTARITAINEDEVRLQLIAGRSALTLAGTSEADGLDRYIDELDLGRAWEQFFPFYLGNSTYPATISDMLFRLSFPPKAGTPDFYDHDHFVSSTAAVRNRIRWGSSDETDCVAFPIYSATDGQYANPLSWNLLINQDGTERTGTPPAAQQPMLGFPLAGNTFGMFGYVTRDVTWRAGENLPYYDGQHYANTLARHTLAPQPYLADIIERIISALGLECADNCLRQGSFKNLFIANARATLYRHQMLPHWTVREFFREVERFCGVWFQINGNQVSIRQRSELTAATPQHITQVVDAFTVEVETDAQQQSTATGSVVYAFTNPDPTLFTPESMFKAADIIDVATISDLPSEVPDTEENRARIWHVTATDHYYAAFRLYTDGDLQLRQINYMGALHRGSHSHDNDADIRLRIVPVAADYRWVAWHVWKKEQQSEDNNQYKPLFTYSHDDGDIAYGRPRAVRESEQPSSPVMRIPVLITQDTRVAKTHNTYNVQGALEGEEQTADAAKQDIIEVAINRGLSATDNPCELNNGTDDQGNSNTITLTSPTPAVPRPECIPYYTNADERHPWNVNSFPYATRFFEMNYLYGRPSGSINKALDADAAYDTATKLTIDFLDTDPYDPTLPFIIRGRRYVCEKIEYAIDDRGIQPLRRGYFYEITE